MAENPHDSPASESLEDEEELQKKEWQKRLIELKPKIHQFFRERRSPEDIFPILCEDLNLPSLTNSQVVEYFQKVRDRCSYYRFKLSEDHCDLVFTIKTEFAILRTGIATWPTADYKNNRFDFLDSRYVLNLRSVDSKLKLFIIDCYHENEIREIQIDGNVPDVLQPFAMHIEVISSELLLIFDYHCDRWLIRIYLARLDLSRRTCTFLDVQQIDGPLWDILFDVNDRRRFAVWSINYSMDVGDLYLAHVEEDSRLVVNPNSIKMEDSILFGRLDGNKLQFLLVNFHDSDDNEQPPPLENIAQFGECSLIPGQRNPNFCKLFDVQMETEPTEGLTCKWFGDIGCFVGDARGSGKISVYILYLNEHRMTTDQAHVYGCYPDFFLENQNILSTISLEYETEVWTVQRFTLKQPDTLTNLAYLKIRREAVFNGSGLYKKVLPNLPAHLKPFANFPAIQNL